MFTVSIKKYIYIFFLFALSFILCGCGDGASGSRISSIDTEQQSSEIVDNANDSDSFSDDAIPKNWLAIYTTSEASERFDEIIGYEHSDDIADVIVSLVNKNVLFFAMIKGELFEIQWDNPIEIENIRVYPVESSIFTNAEAIYEFADITYYTSVVENYLTNAKKGNGKLFYSGENGQLCANTENFSNWSSDPFFSRTYIEITEVTDEYCTFVWHYPDIEGLNAPPEGLKYFYYEKQYTAKCNDGVWKLDMVIFDN